MFLKTSFYPCLSISSLANHGNAPGRDEVNQTNWHHKQQQGKLHGFHMDLHFSGNGNIWVSFVIQRLASQKTGEWLSFISFLQWLWLGGPFRVLCEDKQSLKLSRVVNTLLVSNLQLQAAFLCRHPDAIKGEIANCQVVEGERVTANVTKIIASVTKIIAVISHQPI